MMQTTLVRKIVHIDEEKCDGCGLCVPSCAEGALQIVDGKAKLVSEIYCDGLGACLGDCPQGAISMEEREADAFDEEAVAEHLSMMNQTSQEVEKIEPEPLHQAFGNMMGGGCPGSRMRDMRGLDSNPTKDAGPAESQPSQLRQWPVKLNLVNPAAPYFENAHLLLAADCAPFAYASLHSDFLKGKALVIGCPKFDDIQLYQKKLTAIVEANDIQSITVLHMEVPCCFGLAQVAKQAVLSAGKDISVDVKVVGIEGGIKEPAFGMM